MFQNYRIAGSYYEACNCDAICPCRRQDGIAGGLSTYRNCDFILSWRILEGFCGDIDLKDLIVCMAGTYNNDEDGEPWTVFIYVDEKAQDNQFAALGRIFQGMEEGNILFTSLISKVLAIKRARIAVSHAAGAETIEISEIASVRVDSVVDFDGQVSCGIPGHDHPGRESISSITMHDGAFQWDYKGRCGFSTDFAYWN